LTHYILGKQVFHEKNIRQPMVMSSSDKNNVFTDYITIVKNLKCYLHGTNFV